MISLTIETTTQQCPAGTPHLGSPCVRCSPSGVDQSAAIDRAVVAAPAAPRGPAEPWISTVFEGKSMENLQEIQGNHGFSIGFHIEYV